MKKTSVKLYYVTAGWMLLTVLVGGYFLFSATTPTADVKAKYNPNLKSAYVGDLEPGGLSVFSINGKPIVVWRRSNEEMARALTQLNPELTFDQVLRGLEDGTLAKAVGLDEFTFLEWLVVSRVDVGGIGCIVTIKAGDFGGFLDPCRKSHFDLWGRAVKGLSDQNLKIVPSRFDEELQSMLLDVTDMPEP